MRVVSTTCSNTEIVCALGCAEMLVGVDRHSDFPESVVERLPRVGPDLGVDPELVRALEPDLVLASLTVPGHENVVAALEATGLDVFAPEPVSLSDVYRDIRDIAERLGVADRGEQLVAEMRAIIPEPPAVSADASPGPAVLVEWWPKPVIVPGRMSWVTDLLRAAGARNPWGDEPVKSRPVEPDEVREAAPDAVVISWCGVDPAQYRAAEVYKRDWAGVPAYDQRQVHPIPEAYLGRPGPRLVEGYRAFRELVDEWRRWHETND